MADEKSEPLKVGTEVIACMDLYKCGYVEWVGQKPRRHVMACVSKGQAPPPRSELGDHDQSQWERNDRGEAKDPWVFTHYLPVYDIEAKALYTYVTSSRGGFSAIGVLCRIYSAGRKKYPDSFPVVRLDVGAYDHKQYRRVKIPVLTAVRWVPKSQFYDATGLTPDGTVAGCAGAAPAAQADALDDEVPF
jgi:hypothetical protein